MSSGLSSPLARCCACRRTALGRICMHGSRKGIRTNAQIRTRTHIHTRARARACMDKWTNKQIARNNRKQSTSEKNHFCKSTNLKGSSHQILLSEMYLPGIEVCIEKLLPKILGRLGMENPSKRQCKVAYIQQHCAVTSSVLV